MCFLKLMRGAVPLTGQFLGAFILDNYQQQYPEYPANSLYKIEILINVG